jgi:hypothetical protein
MKIKAYLQISKNGKIAISRKPHKSPLHNNGYRGNRKYYPTIQFILNINVPNELFEPAERELNLELERSEILKEVEIQEENREEQNEQR